MALYPVRNQIAGIAADARRGCIYRMEEVEKLVNELMNMPLTGVWRACDEKTRKTVEYAAEWMLEEEYGQDTELVKSLSYANLLSMTAKSKIIPYRQRTGDQDAMTARDSVLNFKHPFKMYGVRCLSMLFCNAEKGGDVFFRLFMAMDIRAFLRYLMRRSNAPASPDLWRVLVSGAEKLNITIETDMTVKEVMTQLIQVINSAWGPWERIEDYQGQMDTAYRMLSLILVDGFRYAYPEKFRL